MILFIFYAFLNTFASAAEPTKAPLQIVASFSILEDLVKKVVSPEIQVVSLVPRDQDPHHFEPGPKERRSLALADLIVMNGAHFESWFLQMKDQLKNKNILSLIDGISTPIASSMDPNEKDPHAWLSPENAIIYILQIEKKAAELAPQHKNIFHQRSLQSQKSIRLKAQFWKEKFAKLTHKKIATSHASFQYFAEPFGLKIYSLQGANPHGEMRPQSLARMIQKIKTEEVKVLFLESNSPLGLVQQISRETGSSIGGILYPENLPPQAPHFEDWLELNAQTIWTALRTSEKSYGQK